MERFHRPDRQRRILRRRGPAGLYAAVGCNGAGVIKGTIHGRLLAERIAGQRSAMLDDLEALEKPNWLPPDPLRRIGVLTAIACQVRKAGLEK